MHNFNLFCSSPTTMYTVMNGRVGVASEWERGKWNGDRKGRIHKKVNLEAAASAMVPGLVLFKAWQISWKKEQKLGFFPWIKNNLITFHRIFVLILELISKIHKGEMKFPRFCYFWRVILQIMSCLIECFFSCWNWIANTSKFQSEIFAFLGTFLFKIQQIFEKRTKFVL